MANFPPKPQRDYPQESIPCTADAIKTAIVFSASLAVAFAGRLFLLFLALFHILRGLRALRGYNRPSFLTFHHAKIDLAPIEIDAGHRHTQQIAEPVAVALAV